MSDRTVMFERLISRPNIPLSRLAKAGQNVLKAILDLFRRNSVLQVQTRSELARRKSWNCYNEQFVLVHSLQLVVSSSLLHLVRWSSSMFHPQSACLLKQQFEAANK